MTRPDPANTIRALDPYWTAIQNGATRAQRNLNELQPHTTHVSGDPAITDKHAYDHCVNLIRNEIVRLHNLIAQYDYPVAGEVPYGTNVRQVGERYNNEHADPGCTSCGRAELTIWSPVHKDNLCRWCFDFKYTEGLLPTAYLVTLHDDGIRMTHAIVARELKPAREEAKRLAAATKSRRKTRKKAA